MKAGGGMKDGSDGYHPMTPTATNKSPLVWGILATSSKPSTRPMFVPRFMICLLVFISSIYFLYTINLLLSSPLSHRQLPCPTTTSSSAIADPVRRLSSSNISVRPPTTVTTATRAAAATGLQHIVFGIAASASLWDQRKDYIKLWWRPHQMRGFVWLDMPVKEFDNSSSAAAAAAAAADGLPALKLSAD
ncbi:hypothetical protein COCNU_07G007690 [Cocos nucifera]|uniref:Uncharacterized protein n=1 Tax=Cocos nucifera TaxID=13894 RepID=A0A8K0IFF2_COCNU|nr:hypothetical protein COCNU_07G007690 [Cocos nucifera]